MLLAPENNGAHVNRILLLATEDNRCTWTSDFSIMIIWLSVEIMFLLVEAIEGKSIKGAWDPR